MKLLSSRILLLLVCLQMVVNNSFGQDTEARVAAFNEAIGASYNVESKGKILIISGFREGEQVKEDKVNIYDLDLETLKFSKTDNSVSIKCQSDLEGCVTQVLTRERKKKNYRNRIVFGIPEGVSGQEILNKLRSVLNEMMKK